MKGEEGRGSRRLLPRLTLALSFQALNLGCQLHQADQWTADRSRLLGGLVKKNAIDGHKPVSPSAI